MLTLYHQCLWTFSLCQWKRIKNKHTGRDEQWQRHYWCKSIDPHKLIQRKKKHRATKTGTVFSANSGNQLCAHFALKHLGWSVHKCTALNMDVNATITHWRHIKIQSVKPHVMMVRGTCVHTWKTVWKQMLLRPHEKIAYSALCIAQQTKVIYRRFSFAKQLKWGFEVCAWAEVPNCHCNPFSSCITDHKQVFLLFFSLSGGVTVSHRWN